MEDMQFSEVYQRLINSEFGVAVSILDARDKKITIPKPCQLNQGKSRGTKRMNYLKKTGAASGTHWGVSDLFGVVRCHKSVPRLLILFAGEYHFLFRATPKALFIRESFLFGVKNSMQWGNQFIFRFMLNEYNFQRNTKSIHAILATLQPKQCAWFNVDDIACMNSVFLLEVVLYRGKLPGTPNSRVIHESQTTYPDVLGNLGKEVSVTFLSLSYLLCIEYL